jgi:hypothetical protein
MLLAAACISAMLRRITRASINAKGVATPESLT